MSAGSNGNQNNPQGDSSVSMVTNRLLKSSPNGGKQGPMKATLPVSSLLKQSSTLQNTISPRSSPKHIFDHSGLRSPGSAANKGKSVYPPFSSSIRRTSSLDALYLNGYWLRDGIYIHNILHVDKSTQTDDEGDGKCFPNNELLQFCSPSYDFDSYEKLRQRQRLQRCNNRSQTRSPIAGDHMLTASSQTTLPRAIPVNIPSKPIFAKSALRSSVEGLNQEIERLVLKSNSSNSLHNAEKLEDYEKILQQATPEGHRAPFPEHYRNTRSVNTQTPSTLDVEGSCHSSNSPSRESISPMIPRTPDTSPSDAGDNSSPEQENVKMGTSPRIFLVRSPPDGCERVNLKLSTTYGGGALGGDGDTGRRCPMMEGGPFGVSCSTFKLKPSQGSAFKILQPSSSCSTSKNSPPSS